MRKFFKNLALSLSPAVVAETIETNQGYAIQNVETGKNIRPYKAGVADGNQIILYNHAKWKCMTWDFVSTFDEGYQLKNWYTSKTFVPSSIAESGSNLSQQPLREDSHHWEFIKQPDNTFLIRVLGTDLFLTVSSNKTNSPILLLPEQHTDRQKWRLIKQSPLV